MAATAAGHLAGRRRDRPQGMSRFVMIKRFQDESVVCARRVHRQSTVCKRRAEFGFLAVLVGATVSEAHSYSGGL